MNSDAYSALLIAVMSAATILLRAAPFLIFKNKGPAYVVYLGQVLPPAIIGMLVIYCLKDTVFLSDLRRTRAPVMERDPPARTKRIRNREPPYNKNRQKEDDYGDPQRTRKKSLGSVRRSAAWIRLG